MAFDAHSNFGVSSVAVAPSPATTGTSLTVATGEGTRFPAVPFNATLAPAGVLATPANAEIVRVTARSGDVLTITRAQEGSVARAVVVGDLCVASITAKALTDIETTAARTDTGNTFTQPQTFQNTGLNFIDTGQAIDARVFRYYAANQLMVIDTVNDAQTVLQTTPLSVSRPGDVKVYRDLYEKQRTWPMGHFIDTPFNAADYYALSPMTFTVAAGNVITNAYSLVGRTVWWAVVVTPPAALGGTASSQIYVRFPGGLTAARTVRGATGLAYTTGPVSLQYAIDTGTNYVTLSRMDSAAFALSGIYLYVQLHFWI
jgi:hypothetical protein